MRTPGCISSAPRWTRSIATLFLVGALAAALLLGDASLPEGALALQAPAPFSSPIDPTNDPPVIHALDGDAGFYAAGTGPATLDQGAAAFVTDVDSPLFDGGSVTVSIVAGGVPAEDALGLGATNGVTLSAGTSAGSVVSVYGTAMGTVTQDGVSGASLTIAMDTFANPTAASLLLGAATYENLNALTPVTGSRTIRFVVNDGAGGSASAEVTVTVTGPDGATSVYLPLVLNAR